MKKAYILILLITILIFTGCTTLKKDPSLPENQLSEINTNLKNLNDKIKILEDKVNYISKKVEENSDYNDNTKTNINSLKENFDIVDKRLRIMEGFIYDGKSVNNNSKNNIEERVKKLEDSLDKIATSLSGDSTKVNLETITNKIKNIYSENESIIDNLNKLSEKISYLESSYKNSDKYLMENGNLKEFISNEINSEISKMDFSKYVKDVVELKTEQEFSKLYYENKKEEIQKIETLTKKVDVLQDNIKNLSNEFEMVSSNPAHSLDEKYTTQIQEIEKKINTALFSMGNSEIQKLFQNKSELNYIVKSGDTLSEISYAYGLGYSGIEILKSANNLKNAGSIRVGQRIKIPVGNIEKYIKWPLKTTRIIDYDRIVVKFGERTVGGITAGIGILPKSSERIYPILPGKIIETGKDAKGTYYVKIDHGNSIVSVISNLYVLYTKIGKWVGSTDSLGSVKKDKLVMIELWKEGEPRDPLKLFFKLAGQYKATYYTEWDDKHIYSPTFRVTKSGKIPKNFETIAADPKKLPIGTVVYIPQFSKLPNSGFFVVEDIGSSIKGNRIDIYINDVRNADIKKDVTLYIVGQEG
ncbi:peptidase M23 [Tepiditoga spiralis]|uniref:Peptidase M23 n=1 Tax=Tepiditoga spiralis TaxID=2108365 RepID=A0A7G1G9Y4_9BACT|nr:3D domain-containing protein [Tepiditoga spiralis]BBE31827.1 peptidase M23 [Tepiditoga spiralis]